MGILIWLTQENSIRPKGNPKALPAIRTWKAKQWNLRVGMCIDIIRQLIRSHLFKYERQSIECLIRTTKDRIDCWVNIPSLFSSSTNMFISGKRNLWRTTCSFSRRAIQFLFMIEREKSLVTTKISSLFLVFSRCTNINHGWRAREEHARLLHSSPHYVLAENKQEKREQIALIRQAILSFALRSSSEKTLRTRRTAKRERRWRRRRRESIKIILSSSMMLLYFFACVFSFVNERIDCIQRGKEGGTEETERASTNN